MIGLGLIHYKKSETDFFSGGRKWHAKLNDWSCGSQ